MRKRLSFGGDFSQHGFGFDAHHFRSARGEPGQWEHYQEQQQQEEVLSTDGSRKQTVQINTSGNEDLILMDIYGSLQLESCDDKQCNVPVTFTYLIKNIG